MGKKREDYTDEELIDALYQSHGIIASASRRLGVTRETLYAWINKDEKFKLALQQGRERFVDITEGALLKNIKKGKEASIIFALKTIGKDRGYAERIEITDRSKLEDQISGASDKELLDMIAMANER